MCDEKQTTIERENEDKEKTVERLMNFIKENPYPDYKSIECDLLLKQEQSLEQYAEYGEINLNPIRVFFLTLTRIQSENTVRQYTIEGERQHYNKTIVHYRQC